MILCQFLTYKKLSETVIEDRYNLEHGSKEWYKSLDMHFDWLLQYRLSPYFCRWGDNMRVLTYTCPYPGASSPTCTSLAASRT